MAIIPKISVIVPVYNTEKYLHRCIDSILSQNFTDFELLLIDDGSKDGSGAICNEYAAKDNRVRVFHKENGGVSSARNLGLDNANGEWIAFVDSDDWVEKQYLLSMFEYSVYDFVFLNINDSVFEKTVHAQGDAIGNLLFQMIYKYSFYCVWGKLFKKEIIKSKKIKFDVILNSGEDTVFLLQYLLYMSSCCMVHGTYYNYLDRGLSKSKMSYLKFKTITEKIISQLVLLENKYSINIDLAKLYYVDYFIYRLDVSNLNLIQTYKTIRDLASHDYFYMLLLDDKYIDFGPYGNLIKFLFKKRLYLFLSFIVKYRKCIFN